MSLFMFMWVSFVYLRVHSLVEMVIDLIDFLSDEVFAIKNGVLGVSDEIVLGWQTDRVLVVRVDGEHGRCVPVASLVYDHRVLVAACAVGDYHATAAEVHAEIDCCAHFLVFLCYYRLLSISFYIR